MTAPSETRLTPVSEKVLATTPRRHSSVAPVVAFIVAVLGTLLLTRGWGEFGNHVVVVACINIVVVAGLHVLVQWAGQVSLGQVAFVAIGAFVTARGNADFELPLPVALAAGTLAAVAAAVIVGLPALRLRGFALAIATLAFGFAADSWLFLQAWLVPTSSGVALRDEDLFGFTIRDSRELVVPVVLIAAIVVALTVRLGSSGVGRALRVVAHDEEVATSYGISVGAHKVFAFLVAGACAGLAGGLTVASIGRAGPAVFPPTTSILYISAVLLGGSGPVWGSLVAAAGLGAFPILVGGAWGHYVGLLGPLAILFTIRVHAGGLNEILRRQAAAAAYLADRLRRRTQEDM